jgi:hypothetical protein
MWWFIRRLFMLWLILAAICAAVIVIARREPVPDTLQAFGFDMCAGKPCLRGVTVGMSQDQMLNKLRDVTPYSTMENAWVVLFNPVGGAPHKYYLYFSSIRSLESIALWQITELKIPLGWLVARYGSPRCIEVSSNMGEIEVWLRYPKFSAAIVFPDGASFSPAAFITSFVVQNSPLRCSGQENPLATWRGLKTLEWYVDRAAGGKSSD